MPLLAYITMAAVFITAPIIAQATPRSDEVLCEEVAEAVNESVLYGTLTQEQADRISDRCYTLFVY